VVPQRRRAAPSQEAVALPEFRFRRRHGGAPAVERLSATLREMTPTYIGRVPAPHEETVHFDFDQDRVLFRDSVRALLAKECTPERLRELAETESARARELWAKLAGIA
jgi:hypothetical protein